MNVSERWRRLRSWLRRKQIERDLRQGEYFAQYCQSIGCVYLAELEHAHNEQLRSRLLHMNLENALARRDTKSQSLDDKRELYILPK